MEVIDSLKLHKPDIICIAGDLIDRHRIKPSGNGPVIYQTRYVLSFLKACAEIRPTFMSLGNHEWMLCEEDFAIMTETGGKVWAQTIFYPFLHCSEHGRGIALNTKCDCDTYQTSSKTDVPYIESIAVYDDNNDTITLFAVNRSLDGTYNLELSGFDGYCLQSHTVLTGNDLNQCNTAANPNAVVPCDAGTDMMLSPHSWNMFIFSKSQNN